MIQIDVKRGQEGEGIWKLVKCDKLYLVTVICLVTHSGQEFIEIFFNFSGRTHKFGGMYICVEIFLKCNFLLSIDL